jgi:phenylacetaldehyde dehydrogenase
MSSTTFPSADAAGYAGPRLPGGPRGLLIDGEFVDAADGATTAVFGPATGEEIAAGAEDVDRAVRVARICAPRPRPSSSRSDRLLTRDPGRSII